MDSSNFSEGVRMGRIDGLDILYSKDKSEDVWKRECANKAFLPRLNTWAFAHMVVYMLSPRYPRGNWGDAPEKLEWAKRFLYRIDQLLASGRNLSKNDTLIAKDIGGEEQLWKIRNAVRDAQKLIDEGDLREAKKKALLVSSILFSNAVGKYTDCVLDENSDALEGVSTTHKRRKQPELYDD